MARPLRVEFPDAVYHLTSRGNAQQTVFLDDEDRRRFLAALSRVVRTRKWICHAYCLMGNHYHLLVETPEPTLSRGMRDLNGTYTQAFNRRHGRTGHVLQGRFHAVVVEKEAHLLELCRYVVLNPARAEGMGIRRPEEWPWSSYLATAGLSTAPAFLSTDWLLARFGQRRDAARRRYQAFVAQGLGVPSPMEKAAGGWALGSKAFVANLRAKVQEKAESAEHAVFQRKAGRPTLVTLLPIDRGGGRAARNDAIRSAYFEHGYTQKAIADHLGLHYSTVSRLISEDGWKAGSAPGAEGQK